MKLIPAPGSVEMQQASSHPYVHEIVDLLLSFIDQDFFREVALFLRSYDGKTRPGFVEKLQALHTYARPDKEGNYGEPPYIENVLLVLEKIYAQSEVKVNFHRGAIVELLTKELVLEHCEENECFDNYRFIDRQRRYTSDQVDVAVLSEKRQQIEGYTCKMNSQAVMSSDCTNLTALTIEALYQGYNAHTGVVAFDNSRLIKLRTSRFSLSIPIDAYGIDNMQSLQDDPFDR